MMERDKKSIYNTLPTPINNNKRKRDKLNNNKKYNNNNCYCTSSCGGGGVIKYPLGRPLGDLLNNNNGVPIVNIKPLLIDDIINTYNNINMPTPNYNRPVHLRIDTLPILSILYKPPGYTCTSSTSTSSLNRYNIIEYKGKLDNNNKTIIRTSPSSSSCAAVDFVNKYINMGSINNDITVQCGFIHRLDIFTSGIVMVAHNYSIYYQLIYQFKNRLILKRYICLVHGHMNNNNGIINTLIYTINNNNNKLTSYIGNNNKGKEAITKWRLINKYTINVKKHK